MLVVDLEATCDDRTSVSSACSCDGALARTGLTLQGTHHRGIDDARNIARLLPWITGHRT